MRSSEVTSTKLSFQNSLQPLHIESDEFCAFCTHSRKMSGLLTDDFPRSATNFQWLLTTGCIQYCVFTKVQMTEILYKLKERISWESTGTTTVTRQFQLARTSFSVSYHDVILSELCLSSDNWKFSWNLPNRRIQFINFNVHGALLIFFWQDVTGNLQISAMRSRAVFDRNSGG